MIFSPDLAAKVLTSEKTVTRRRANDGLAACTYEVGKTYAVQPGRGKKQLGRIRIISAELQWLQQLTKAEARREGFASPADFRARWIAMYGDFPKKMRPGATILNALGGTPVWRIEFELVAA